MKHRNKRIALFLSLALCAALTVACGSVTEESTDSGQTATAAQGEADREAAQAPEDPVSAGEEADKTAAEETQPSTESGADASFDEDALLQALEDVCNVGPGAAGSNLRAVKAAGELVLFSAENWNDAAAPAITERIAAWWEEIPGEGAEEFDLAWDTVSGWIRDIAEHPTDPDVIGPLEDAGLPNLPLSTMDLTNVADLIAVIDSICGPNDPA